MRVVITGGAGFLGTRLARALLTRGRLRGRDGRDETIERMTLVDVAPPVVFADPRVVAVTGDIADANLIERVVADDTTSVFHLAAVVSGQAESDFDLGMRINVDATRLLLDVCRVGPGGASRPLRPTLIFTSSIAVYGGTLPDVVPEDAAVAPQSSYGMQKAVGELLINDYTRRGFIDGRVLRLPTITVRPGRPNAAASSFASAIIREPLNGEEATCPVSPDTRLWLASPATAVGGLVAAHDLSGQALGSNRILNAPGISVTAGEMVDALARVAGSRVAERVRWVHDPRISAIVATWPGALDVSRARALGLPGDEGVDAIVRRYIAEELPAWSG
jgi:nucleoside-diphosphate-sugar epimerase